MNIIFFNNPIGTEKINFIVTEKTLLSLKNEGVIPKNSVTLIKKYDAQMDHFEKSILVHIDKVVFDNYENPREVFFDLDLVKMFFLDLYRNARAEIFKTLDALQLRAIISGNTDVLIGIEEDKAALRNMPDDVAEKMEGLDCFFKINKVIPNILLVDYAAKYEYMLK
jgi:hypothetical protein